MCVKENFVPPKTWKRNLPSSGRWSFKLALESTRAGQSSTSPSASESGNGSTSGNNGPENDSNDDTGEGATAPDQEEPNQRQLQELDTPDTEDSPPGGGSSGQTQEGSTDDNNNASSNVPGISDVQPSTSAFSPKTKDTGVDNWPGRAVCREVSEKYLSWEFQEGDFCVSTERDATGNFGDSEEQREEGAAIRAALVRRQAKLRAVLTEILHNEEVGAVGTA